MAWSTNKAIQGLISGGVAAAPSGNPYLIAGSSIANAALSGFSGPEKPNFQKYRKAMNRIGRGVRTRARRDAAEVGSQLGSSLARRGLNQSGLGAGVVAGNQRRILQRASDYENQLRTSAELDIAQAEAAADLADREELRRDWGNIATSGILLADRLAHQPKVDAAANAANSDPATMLAKLLGQGQGGAPAAPGNFDSRGFGVVGYHRDGTPIHGLRPGTVRGNHRLRGYNQQGQAVWEQIPVQGPQGAPQPRTDPVPNVSGTDLSVGAIHDRSSLNPDNQRVLGQDPNESLLDIDTTRPPHTDPGVTPPDLDITPEGIHNRQMERYPQLGEMGRYAQELEDRVAQSQGAPASPGTQEGTTISPMGDATIDASGNIQPRNSNVSFAPNSPTGQMYTSNPSMATYLADSLTGNWVELMEILQPPA